MRSKTWKHMSRLFGRLLIFTLLTAAGGGVPQAAAQTAPAMTLVQDRLFRADGTPAQGTVTVRWQGFTTAEGAAVASGELTAVLDAQGNLSIQLAPNAGALPGGGYYKATIKLNDGTASEEVWVVPQATTATLAQIRSKAVPQSVAAQFVTQSTLQSAIAAALATPGPIGIKSPSSINATVVWTQVSNGEYNAGSFNTVQNAIATATAAGVYKVKIPEGTYRGGVTIPAGVTLECVSRRAVLTLANGANADVITIPSGAANVTIRNCSIDGNAANQTATSRGIATGGGNSNITLDNVSVANTRDECVDQWYGNVGADGNSGTFNTNFRVTNSNFSGCGANGIYFRDTKGVWIQNNSFTNWGAVNPQANAIKTAGFSYGVHINGNTGDETGGNSVYWFMESASPGWQHVVNDADISGNTITATAQMAGAGFSGYFFNTNFTNNTLRMPGGSGCTIGLSMEIGGSNVTFSHNTLVNGSIIFGPYAATIDHNTFSVDCAAQGLHGLIMGGAGGPNNPYNTLQNIRVLNNTFDLTGISATQAHSVTPVVVGWYGTTYPVNGYEIAGNTIRQNANNGAWPVTFYNPDGTKTIQNVSIHGNTINTNGGYDAIRAWDTTLANVSGLQVYGNDFSGSPNGFGTTGAAANVSQWNNKYGASDTVQHLNGDATVDTGGNVTAAKVTASTQCLGTSCITAWPTGGGGSGSITINGQSCALGGTCTVADATKVPSATTVNGHALTANVTVTPGDVGNTTAQWNANQVNGASVPASAAVVGTNGSGQLVSAPRYAVRSCGVGLGDGTNAIAAGTYTLGAQCRNTFGTAFTITGVACYTDSGSTTINVSDSASNALLTGAIAGTSTWASGTQSGTTTLASGAWTTWTITADGATKLVSCTLTGTI